MEQKTLIQELLKPQPKEPPKYSENRLIWRKSARRTALQGYTAGSAWTHGLQHCCAAGRATFLGLQHGRASSMHGRQSFCSLSFALSGLRLTSILPLIPCESHICSQNPKILPESTDKPQYQRI